MSLSSEEEPPSTSPSPEKEREPTILRQEQESLPQAQRFILLIAEDNLPDDLLVREAIRVENLPLEVYSVRDGQQAIEFLMAAETNGPEAPRPDFVLLDINLPRKNGFEVLRMLRASAKFAAIPAVVMSSSNGPMDQKQATELGAVYFRKPVRFEEFMKLGIVLARLIATRNVK